MAIKLSSVFVLASLLMFAVKLSAESAVFIEFFYFDPSQSSFVCWTCSDLKEVWNQFIDASNLMDEIQREYGNQIQIERVDKTTPEGLARFKQYGLTGSQAVVLNHKIKLEGAQLNKENLEWYIGSYLRGEDPSASTHSISALFVFSLGLFSGLSPCLMAMLAFILSYTFGTVSNFKSGIWCVLVFGVGFISAILLLGTLLATIIMAIPSIYIALMWAVSVLMILIGLHLVGWLNIPFHTKPLAQKMAQIRARGATTIGLFSLGFMSYFVNLCTAPLSFTIFPTLTSPGNLYLLAFFGVGVLIPFFAVGILAGGSPALAKRIREQYRIKIRAFSGVILLAYSVWFIVFNLLYTKIFLAFTIFSSYSLSLVAIIAFIGVYSASVSMGFKDVVGKSVIFALGLIFAIVFVAWSLLATGVSFYLALFKSLPTIEILIVVMMISIGLVLLGIAKIPTSSDSFIMRLAQNKRFTLLCLFFLGFLLFFATVRAFPLTRFITEDTLIDFNLLLAFNLVLLVPFLIAGAISGGVSRLARDVVEEQRLKIRALSGLILIVYAIWLFLM